VPESPGWSNITALSADPTGSGRLVVVGVGPGSTVHGIWTVEGNTVQFVSGTADVIDATFTPDGNGIAYVLAGTSAQQLIVTSLDGDTEFDTTVEEIVRKAIERSPGVTPPDAATAFYKAITTAPPGSGATFAVLIGTGSGGGPLLPTIVLLDSRLDVVRVLPLKASPLSSATDHLDPFDPAHLWLDIVDIAG
jgi:hypothetical protein